MGMYMHTYLVGCILFNYILVQNCAVHCYHAQVDIHIFAEFNQNHNYSTLIQTLILRFQTLTLT